MPNHPTKIIRAKIAWLKLSVIFPMDLTIPPLEFKIMLESNPLKSRILVLVIYDDWPYRWWEGIVTTGAYWGTGVVAGGKLARPFGESDLPVSVWSPSR